MANIKSQKKRIKTNEKARLRNRAAKAEMKTAVRRVREAVEAGDKALATEAARRPAACLTRPSARASSTRTRPPIARAVLWPWLTASTSSFRAFWAS